MALAREQYHLDRTIAFLLSNLDLLHGAILVVLALHDQHRHANISEELGDVPFAELRVEPGAVPALERTVDIVVPAREPRAQVPCFIGFPGFDDRRNARILGEEMRRDQHEAADPVILMTAGI